MRTTFFISPAVFLAHQPAQPAHPQLVGSLELGELGLEALRAEGVAVPLHSGQFGRRKAFSEVRLSANLHHSGETIFNIAGDS